MSVAPLPDLHTLDAAALRDMVIQQHAQISSRDAELERLRLVIARLRRMQFGRKSEKVERQIEQLELQLEDLEARTGQEQQQTENTLPPAAASVFAAATRKPVRRLLPEHLPREVEIHEPKHEDCPACGAALSKLGEDVSEVLEYVPARFKVIRQVRPKLSCTDVMSSCRLKRRAGRLRVASQDQACWRTCSFPNMLTIFRCIARRRFTHAKVWS